jgi:hypothetical protein
MGTSNIYYYIYLKVYYYYIHTIIPYILLWVHQIYTRRLLYIDHIYRSAWSSATATELSKVSMSINVSRICTSTAKIVCSAEVDDTVKPSR